MLRAAIDIQLIAKGGVHAIATRPCLQQEIFFNFKAIKLGGVKALNKRIFNERSARRRRVGQFASQVVQSKS